MPLKKHLHQPGGTDLRYYIPNYIPKKTQFLMVESPTMFHAFLKYPKMMVPHNNHQNHSILDHFSIETY